MKKIFSMMLLMAVVIVGAFTSCKSDDNESGSAAQLLAGAYTGTMHYYFDNHEIGRKDVTFNVTAEGANKVSISIPEITGLAFHSILGGKEYDIKVNKYSSFTVKGVNAVAITDYAGVASKFTTVEEVMSASGEYTLEEDLDLMGFNFKDIDVENFDMEIMGRKSSGKTTVSGDVEFAKNAGKYALEYRFTTGPGVVIYGSLSK